MANSTRIAEIFPSTILLQLIYKSTGAIYYNSCEDGAVQIFKPVKRELPKELPDPEFPADKLPDPDFSPNKKLPSAAIVKANEAFIATIKDSAKPRGSYAHFTPAQRFEIGKRAAEHGVAATIRYYKKRFPVLALKETTVRPLRICTSRR